jgi:hypothetical protein
MYVESETKLNAVEERLRSIDPLRIVLKQDDEEQFACETGQDIQALDGVLSDDPTITTEQRHNLVTLGCNLRLDWMYSDAGGKALDHQAFTRKWNRMDEFFRLARRDAFRSKEEDPRYLWEITSKTLDLHALMAYRNAHEARTTLAGTPQAELAWQKGGDQLRNVILNGAQFMMILRRHINYDGPSYEQQQHRKKSVGTEGEAMSMNYVRLLTYLDNSFGDVFPRLALEREDRHRPTDKTAPKRAFDIVIQGVHSAMLWQVKSAGTTAEESAKNRRPKDRGVVYEAPIRPILLEYFNEVRQQIPEYAAAFRTVVNNPQGVTTIPEVAAASNRLNNRFAEEIGDIYTGAA